MVMEWFWLWRNNVVTHPRRMTASQTNNTRGSCGPLSLLFDEKLLFQYILFTDFSHRWRTNSKYFSLSCFRSLLVAFALLHRDLDGHNNKPGPDEQGRTLFTSSMAIWAVSWGQSQNPSTRSISRTPSFPANTASAGRRGGHWGGGRHMWVFCPFFKASRNTSKVGWTWENTPSANWIFALCFTTCPPRPPPLPHLPPLQDLVQEIRGGQKL